MQRIQDPTAVTSQPAPPTLTGPVGFFQGSLGGVVTRIRYWWLNMVQEELAGFLVAASLPLDGTATVLQAVRKMFNPGRSLRGPIAYGVPGVSSYTPSDGTNTIVVMWVAGGGGGAGSPVSGSLWSGSGGGAGGAGIKRITHTPGRVYTVTVGAFGTRGPAGGSGGNGGTTSFDTICSATGGIAGTANGGGGAGGVAYGADIAFVGAPGSDGIISASGLSNGLFIPTGIGGPSIFGGGGTAGSINNSTASPTFGAGGGGAYLYNNLTGGQAGGGLVLIWEES